MRTGLEATAHDLRLHSRPYHQRVRRLVFLVAAALVLAACGSSDDSGSAATTGACDDDRVQRA